MYRFFFLLVLLFIACQEQSKPTTANKGKVFKKMEGITMGVVRYKLTFEDTENQIKQVTIDSLLLALNMGNSHYEEKSTLSQFNQSVEGIIVDNSGYGQHFIRNVKAATSFFEKTAGYFDPTVAPLMQYYGFREKEIEGLEAIDTARIIAIMPSVGFDQISIQKVGDQFEIKKNNPATQLDFSAIAKGYAIDQVGQFLERKGVQNYLVDIGGEALCKGKNAKGAWWNIAIQDPKAPRGYYHNQSLMLQNEAMATSANYESFRIIDGKKMGHTMNPKTGFPESNDLLSATVVAPDCITADSYATAFMAMGMEKAFNLAQKLPDVEAYLLYVDENGETAIKYTEGLAENVKQLY
ncbi:MAG: FAD:protein FMN transferase [Bacteroidota bacterium]